jgi:hypothetical protein
MISPETRQWLFPIAITLHNLEEAIWLPTFSAKLGIVTVSQEGFSFAVTALTLFGYLITYLSIKQGKESWATYVYHGYVLGMLLNVFFPHLLATLALQQYAPGIITGILINLPVMSYLLWHGFQYQYISTPKFWFIAPIVALAIVSSIPLLFAMAGYVESIDIFFYAK